MRRGTSGNRPAGQGCDTPRSDLGLMGPDDLDRPLSERFGGDDDTVAVWRCPVCATEILHEYRPGRQRVYCSQACRQKAYRWRCDHGVRLLATPWRPAQRSGLAPRNHAVRPQRDFVGQQADHRNRRVAVCGAFATVIGPQHVTHNEFVPGSRSACKSCTRLIGADPEWSTEFPVVVPAPAPHYIRYRPPAERWQAYLERRRVAEAVTAVRREGDGTPDG